MFKLITSHTLRGPTRNNKLRLLYSTTSTAMHTPSPKPYRPRVAIIGGGPGGLALSRMLLLHDIRSQVFELRPKMTEEEYNKPSGMLDLHEDTGLAAMAACGLMDGFNASLGDCSEAVRVRDTAGQLLFADDGGVAARPEIPRNSLLRLLVNSLPESSITWNQKIQGVSKSTADTGKSETASEVVLDLGPATPTQTFDLVIGADGAWSKVRRLLTYTKPIYSGLQYLTATVRHVKERYPELLEISGTGSSFALGNGHGIMTHRGPLDSIRAYISIKTTDENWWKSSALEQASAAEISQRILADDKLFGTWSPDLQNLVKVACAEETTDSPGNADIKGIYGLPISERWQTTSGVTLLGDAAHLMPPNGEGVNLALADALTLSTLLAEIPREGDAAPKTPVEWSELAILRLRAYEDRMFERAAETLKDTNELLDIMHGDGNTAEALAKMFKSFGPPPSDVLEG